MRLRLGFECRSALPRLAMVGLVSSLAAACSTGTARFQGDPFGNPFSTASAKPEPVATGSLPEPSLTASAAPTAPVISQPLAPPTSGATFNQPAPPRIAAPIPAARAPSSGPAGWTAQGGASVTVGAGDSLQAISTRYGVPASAILQANGLSTASQVSAGRQIVIPVFNAVGAPGAVATAPAPARAPVSAPARAAAPAPQPAMRLTEGPKPVVKPAAPKPEPKSEPKKPEPKRAEAKPEPKRADVKKPEPKQAEAKAPAKTASKPEPVRAEPKKAAEAPKAVAAKPEPKKPDAPRTDVPKAVVAQKPAEPAKPAPAAPQPQPQPQRVAALGNPPIAPQPAPAQPAPAKQPEPQQTASLPTNPAATDNDFRWPVKGRVISGFGSGGNEGINIAVPEGTPVKAAEGGTVAYAGNELKGYGNLVLIRHENGYVSAYAHNGEIAVKRGEKIKRGQVIAKSGQSGNVNSPQLHFEIRKGSTPVDPVPYLSN